MQILDEKKEITAEMVEVWIDARIEEIFGASSHLNPNSRAKTHLMQLVIRDMMMRVEMVEYLREHLFAVNSSKP